MKRKSKRLGISIGIVSFSLIIGFAAGILFSNNKETVHAARDSANFISIGELAVSSNRIDRANLSKLYTALVGSDSYEAVEEAAKTGKTSAGFRSDNGGKNIDVVFGGIKWDAVYLTTSTDGNSVILDLWRSSDTLESTTDEVEYSLNTSGNTPTTLYPAAMYSTSKVRVEALNAGGKCSIDGTTLPEVEYAQSAENQYAKFTMNDIGGNLTKFIATPEVVGYQATEWDKATANVLTGDDYYIPNDAYESPTGGKWRREDYNYGAEGRDTNRENNAQYGSWSKDYLWLPSVTETGVEDITADGIWDTDASLRSSKSGIGASYCLLRSGRIDNAQTIQALGTDGGEHHNEVKYSRGVRPALHLNITAADAAALPSKEDWKGDSKPYNPEGVTWVLENTSDVEITPVSEGVDLDTSWWNSETHTITATKIGEYKLKVKPIEGKNWVESGSEEVTATYTVTKAQLRAVFNTNGTMQRLQETHFQVVDPLKFKLPDDDDPKYPIYHDEEGVEDAELQNKVTGLIFKYVIEYHEESKHEEFEQLRDQKLEELKKPENESQWKSFEELEKQSPDKIGGYCVFFKATDPNGNYEDYYDWFGIHIAKEQLEITVTEEALQAYEKGEKYGYAYGTRETLRTGLINSIQSIMAYQDGGFTENRTDELKKNFDNFHFYLRTEDGGGGKRYNFGTNSFLDNEGRQVKYLPVGTYYLYIYYNEASSENPDLENDDNFIVFTWANNERPHFDVSPRKLTITAAATTIIYGEEVKGVEDQLTFGGEDGFAEGEDKSNLDGALTWESNYKQFDDIGEGPYTITPAGYTSSNYEITYVGASLTVNKRPLKVTIEGAKDHEFGDDPEITARLSGVVNSDDVHVELKVTTDDGEGNIFDNIFKGKVGTYTITASLTGEKADNYTLEEEGSTATFTVSTKTIDKPTGDDIEGTYNTEEKTLKVDKYNPETMDAEVSGDVGATFENGVFKATNAGTYTLTITPKEGYTWGDEGSIIFTIKINPYEITLDWDEDNYTYSGETQTEPTATAEGISGEQVKITVTLDGAGEFKDAGDYTFKASTNNPNYTIKAEDREKTYHIKPFSLELEWKDQEFKYNGVVQIVDNPTPEEKPTSENAAPFNISISTSDNGGEFKNAGTYTFTATVDNANYIISENTKTHLYEIKPMELELKWSIGNYIYDGTDQIGNKPTASAEGANNEQVNITVTLKGDGEFKNAGDYTFTASITDTNYVIKSGFEEHLYQIKKVTIEEVDWTFNGNDTYDGDVKTSPTATAQGVISDGTLHLEVALTEGNSEFKNAGDYTFTASLKEENETNYELAEKAKTKVITINPMELNLNWGTTELTYNGEARQAPSLTAQGAGNESVEIVVTPNFEGQFKDVGTYGFTASTADTNYTITNDTQDFTISEAAIENITWNVGSSYTYNGKVQATPTATAQGLGDDGTLTLEVTLSDGGSEFKNAGNYTFTASLNEENAKNYKLTGTATKEITIAKASLTVSLSQTSNPYSGVEHVLNIVFGGLQNKEELKEGTDYDVSIEKGDQTSGNPLKVGTYNITVILNSTDLANNYTLSDGKLTYTITQAQVTKPTADEMTITTTYDGKNHGFDIEKFDEKTMMGELTGDSGASFTSGKFEATDAGTYTLTITLKDKENYTWGDGDSVVYKITISPMELNLEWGQTELTYNGEVQTTPTLTAQGAGNESVEINVEPKFEGQFKDVGEYTFLASTTNKNYTITNNEETFSIGQATLENVSWEIDDSYTYNGKVQTKPTAKAEGVGSDGTLNLEVALSSGNSEFKDAGDYTFTASLSAEDGKNYVLSGESINKQIKINQAKLTAHLGQTSGSYDGEEHILNIEFEGEQNDEILKKDDDYSVTIKKGEEVSGNPLKVGKYTIIITLVSNDKTNNYILTSGTLTYTVTQVQVSKPTIEGNNEFTYNGGNQGLTLGDGFDASTMEAQASQGATFDSTSKKFEAKNAGIYTLTITLKDKENYTWGEEETVTFTLTIKPMELELYWGTTELTYNGNEVATPTLTAQGAGNESVDIVVTPKFDGEFKNVGEYEFIASTENTNYTIKKDSQSQVFIIKPAPLEVSWEDGNYTYNGSTQDNPVATLTSTSKPYEGDEVTITTSTTETFKNAGKYTFTAVTNNSNYEVTNKTKEYEIKKADISVKLGSYSSNYNGEEQNIEIIFEGLIGDTLVEGVDYIVSITGEGLSNGKPMKEGTYNIIISLNRTDKTRNYNLTNSTLTYTINPGVVIDPSIDSTGFVLLFLSQFLIGIAALLLIRRRRSSRIE